MRKAYPVKAIISAIFTLVCLLFQSNSMARAIEFDTDLSAFILKNAPALVSQIKHHKGVGLESLTSQLELRGCDANLLNDIALIEQKDSYAFFTYLMGKIDACSSEDEEQNTLAFADVLKGKTPYLLVAGESLNSPMSYFGHSLLLFLDEDDFYFSPVLSVLAPLESKQLFSQTLKGGFSSIKAEINLTPLHQVISYYNNYESRSLRFIKLPTAQFDNDKLIQYFDQTLTDPLSYNFFLKNCATYIYRALNQACDCLDEDKDIISPAMMEAQIHKVAPSSDIFELPSLLTQFNLKYQNLSDFEQLTVRQMVQEQGYQYQGLHQDLGDVAVLASRLSFETYKQPYPSYFGLLETYGNKAGLLDVIPEAKPATDQEKDKLNLSSLGVIYNDDEISASLALIDYSQFYQRQKNVYSSSLRAGVIEVSGVDESSKLDDLSVLEISTLKPLNFVSKGFSWRFKLGAERNRQNELRPLLRYSLGASVATLGAKFYLLPSLQLSDSTHMPVYSGFETQIGLTSLSYENKDLEDHELRLYKRMNASFALQYQATKLDKTDLEQSASAFYYF
jgi:hypothetical protein